MALFETLPRDVVMLILDYFNPTQYKNEFERIRNLLTLARVNRYFRNLLFNDALYEKWWKQYVSNTLPEEREVNVALAQPNICPKFKRRFFYFHTLKLLNKEPVILHGWMKFGLVSHAINCGYEKVFDSLFDPADYTKEKDLQYFYRQHCEDYSYRDPIPMNEYLQGYSNGRRRFDLFMHAAINQKNRYFIDRLLDSGLYSKDLVYARHNELLNFIIGCGLLDKLKILLERCADIPRASLIQDAIRYGLTDIMEYLLEKGDVPTRDDLVNIILGGKIECVKLFVARGFDLTETYPSTLKHIVKHNMKEMATYVISSKYKDSPEYAEAFKLAFHRGHYELAELLAKAGVRKNIKITLARQLPKYR